MKVDRSSIFFIGNVSAYDISILNVEDFSRGWRRLYPDKKIHLNIAQGKDVIEYVY